jgi:hypothetical protein
MSKTYPTLVRMGGYHKIVEMERPDLDDIGPPKSYMCGAFHYRHVGDTIEVWLGPPGDPESEFTLCVVNSRIPELITALRNSQESRV